MTTGDERNVGARADLCRFLAACYYEPGPAFGEERLFDSMLEAAARIHPDLAAHAQRLGEAFGAQDPQTLLVDYARLFLGPPRPLAAPYGSFWLGGDPELMAQSTVAVRNLYREFGFDLDEEFLDLPDHVAVELEFLYLLIFAEKNGLRRRFLSEHLGRWIDPFTACVRAAAETAFYRELSALTRRVVQMEAARAPVA